MRYATTPIFLVIRNKPIHHGNGFLAHEICNAYKHLLVHLIRNFSSLLINTIFLSLLRNNQMSLALANYIKHMLGKNLCNMDLILVDPNDWCQWILMCVMTNKVL